MILRLKIANYKHFLQLFCQDQESRSVLHHLLQTRNLEGVKDYKKENSIFTFSWQQLLKNNDFFQLLFWFKKRTKVNLQNDRYNCQIESLLEDFSAYEEKIYKQEQLYQKIIQGKLKLKNINYAQFRNDFQAKPFQIEHARFALTCQRSANFSAPGAGKTIITYMVAASLFADQEINTLVVVGPKSAVFAWKEEWKVVTDCLGSFSIFDLTNNGWDCLQKLTLNYFASNKLNLIFVNFHKFHNDDFSEKMLDILQKRQFFLVIDEAHYMKNKKGSRFQNLIKLSRVVKYTLILTGTPLPHSIVEGSYIPTFLFPVIEKRQGLEVRNFEQADKKNIFGNLINPQLYQKLADNFQKIFVRKSKKDLIDANFLKPIKEHLVAIEMNECENFIIERLKVKGYNNLLDVKTINKMNKILFIRRMQASSYPPLLLTPLVEATKELSETVFEEEQEEIQTELKTPKQQPLDKEVDKIIASSEFHSLIYSYIEQQKISPRWKKALEIIQKKEQGRIIVWDVFKKSMVQFQKYLQSLLPNRSVFLINGEVIGEQRTLVVENFKKNSNAVLIASSATISESISFHRHVHCAIYLYKNYVGSHFMQSKNRIHRLVGKNEINYEKNLYFIEAKSPSIDQMIKANLATKTKQQKSFIN